MKKKYKLLEDQVGNQMINEPAIEYTRSSEMSFSPPLTEEELQKVLTTEQVKEHLHKHIHKLFNP